MAKEKLEDMQWLGELYGLLSRHHDNAEIQAEIDKVKHKLATYDYAPREARRQASIARLGRESVYW